MDYFYQPAEDSYFLVDVVKKYLKKKKIKELNCLDLGTGSGIQSQNLLDLKVPKANITATDINPAALYEAKKLRVKTKKSDLFKNLREKFDLIIFNPPYLPENKFDKKPDTTGGKLGDEVIIRFIKTLHPRLTKKGACLLLTSSQTPEKKWKKIAKEKNLRVKKIATKKAFFEKFYVWEIKCEK